MLDKLVRRLFAQIGFEDISSDDVTRFIALCKLDRLNSKYTFALVTILPIFELIIKKIKSESIDFSELID